MAKTELEQLTERALDLAFKNDWWSIDVLSVNKSILFFGRDPFAYMRLGRYYMENGHEEEALKCFQKITENDPDICKNIAKQNILKIKQKCQKREQAKELNTQEELKKRLNKIDFKTVLDCYNFICEYKKTIKSPIPNAFHIIEYAKNLVQNDSDRFWLALLYQRLGKAKGENALLISLFKQSTDSGVAALFRFQVSPEKAILYCRRVLKKQPNNIYIKNCLYASLLDSKSHEALLELKKGISAHGIGCFRKTIFGFLSVDLYGKSENFLKFIQNRDPTILIEYKTTLHKYNVRQDKIDKINKIQ